MELDDLVRRVNVVYHDVEGAGYQELHPEIFDDEAHRWKRLAEQCLAVGDGPRVVLDVGCGTGFVGMQIGHFLNADDRLICADVSSVMLDVARSNLAKLRCRMEFVRLDGLSLPLADSSCDVVTLNATLHHIPDLRAIFGQISRVTRPGGRVLIGHEPNKAHYQGGLPRLLATVAGAAFTPRQALGEALRRIGVIDLVRRLSRPFSRRDALYNRTLEEVNRILLSEGSIDSPLTQDQLTALVDVHSPTAGGFRPGRGIDLPWLAKEYLPAFSIEMLQTHNHLGDHLSSRNRLTRWLDAHLAARYPHQGATVMAVLRKGE